MKTFIAVYVAFFFVGPLLVPVVAQGQQAPAAKWFCRPLLGDVIFRGNACREV